MACSAWVSSQARSAISCSGRACRSYPDSSARGDRPTRLRPPRGRRGPGRTVARCRWPRPPPRPTQARRSRRASLNACRDVGWSSRGCRTPSCRTMIGTPSRAPIEGGTRENRPSQGEWSHHRGAGPGAVEQQTEDSLASRGGGRSFSRRPRRLPHVRTRSGCRRLRGRRARRTAPRLIPWLR